MRPRGKDQSPESLFTAVLSAAGTEQEHKQGHTLCVCVCVAVSPVCKCVCLHHAVGFCQGSFDYPVLRESSPWGVWMISLWIWAVTSSLHVIAHTHIHTHILHTLARRDTVNMYSPGSVRSFGSLFQRSQGRR